MKLSGRQLRQIILEEIDQYDLPPLSPKELERISRVPVGGDITHPTYAQSKARREKRIHRPGVWGDQDSSDYELKSGACGQIRVPKNDPFVAGIYDYLLKSTPDATRLAARAFLGADDLATSAGIHLSAKKATGKIAKKFIPIAGWIELGEDVAEFSEKLSDARSQDICKLLSRLDLAYYGSMTRCNDPSDCDPISLRDWQTKYSAYLLAILNHSQSKGYGPIRVVQGFVKAGWLRGSEATDLKNLIERPDTTAQKEAT